MFLLRLCAFLPLLLAVLTGCDTSPRPGVSATGAMRLFISTPSALPGDVARVTVTVSAPDMASLSTELVLTDGTWGGVLGDIPAGEHRTFLARAFTSANTLRYEGRAEDVTVTAGTPGLVSLTLQDVSFPPPFTNEAPLVDSLVANSTSVTPGGSVSLAASAHDPNVGDTLSFTWTAPSGSFAAATQASTTWTAPTTQGPVNLSLTVSDSHGASLTVSVTVMVSAGSGGAEVKVSLNTAPTVVSLTSSQSSLDVGQQTALSVSATDVDGDDLSYQWSATCVGSFTGASSSSATFTPSALPTTACNNCQVSVTVTDGRGGQNTGSLAVCVSKDAARHAPPMIARSYQSSPTAKASQVLTFEVEAIDPSGSALGFAWTASLGTLGTAASGASSSSITWTAPTCVSPGTTPRLTATVTNAFGLKVSRSFTVTGLLACTSASWAPTSAMVTPRYLHTATLLPNGKVLVVGGKNVDATLATVEVYDPATGTWSPTGSMTTPRYSHTATLLPNGKVLVVGGIGSGFLATAEVYDPATGTWNPTGSMSLTRYSHTATLLPNGQVLVAGGYDNGGSALVPAEVYDPATGTWRRAGNLAMRRFEHTATLLPNGKVLIVGGYNTLGIVGPTEVYDPAADAAVVIGSPLFSRYRHGAVLLSNGQVLVAGGQYSATAELYDPVAGSWHITSTMATPRTEYTATLLPNGKVLVSGGTSARGSFLTMAEVYDPATGTWRITSAMATSRGGHTATLLPNGKVLISGGYNGFTYYLRAAEVYDPGTGS
ncbi:Kelch repeat-containing protein [Cystobacter ferrugineus]|uniref:Branched-chain amino acid ABC transporter substrate-binding protein n=1 Tax=Cystobacter ferrugineus TaxID=83449 RepID=A0A1L9B3W4_9BACT|nr:kelch repeat-containing protein [Cystobacter ferrugineus]OJH36916.1 branched-chain amino acid ABC transporter substrate-binding protein [Cystobacter ferrugineus]